MKFRVFVSFKASVLDPQGQTISNALASHGHPCVKDVRQGKFFDIVVEGDDAAALRSEIETIARDVLANPVIEDFRVEQLA